MSSPKQKPTASQPKMKQGGNSLPKEAGRMLMDGYRAAEQSKYDRYSSPEQSATEKVEGAMRRGGNVVNNVTDRAAHQTVNQMRQAYSKAKEKKELARQEAARASAAAQAPPEGVAHSGYTSSSSQNVQAEPQSPPGNSPKTRESVLQARGNYDPAPKTRHKAAEPKTRQVAYAEQKAARKAKEAAAKVQYTQGRNAAAEKAEIKAAQGKGTANDSPHYRPTATSTPTAGSAAASGGGGKAQGDALKNIRRPNTAVLKTRQSVAKQGVKTKPVAGAGKRRKNDKLIAGMKKRSATARAKKAAVKKAKAMQAKQAAKATGKVAKTLAAVAKAMAKVAVKGAMALGKILIAIAPILLQIIFIALILVVVASPLGFFFSDEYSDNDTMAVNAVVQQVNTEYLQKIEDIKRAETWDKFTLDYTGPNSSRGDNWVDVLAVFAVKTSMAHDGMDVVTIDATRASLIRDVFFDMNTLSHYIEEVEYEVPVLDENGEDTGETTTETERILHVQLNSRTGQQQAVDYNFTRHQNEMLEEMLSGEYDSYFRKFLMGTGGLSGDGTGVVSKGFYIWPSPVSDYVSSPYGNRPGVGYGDFHYGIDISAGYGTPIIAAANGTVAAPNGHWSYGINVVIDHADGHQTLYAHMSATAVNPGDTVSAGDVIGYVGSSGMSSGPHLHFETRINGSHYNPLDYFDNYTVGW